MRYVEVGRVPVDLNGDGYSDVVVGAPYEHHDAASDWTGGVHVYRGSAAGVSTDPAESLTEPDLVSWAEFGDSISFAGDVQADGFGDLVVGAYHREVGGLRTGGAFAYFGTVSGLAILPSAELENPLCEPPCSFGDSVGGVGDVNADGFSDVVVGDPITVESTPDAWGVAFAYHGMTGGLGTSPATTLLPDTAIGRAFGDVVVPAGDTNGDGYSDVLVGAPGGSSSSERLVVYVFEGASAGLGVTSAATIAEPEFPYMSSSDRLSLLAGLGDTNGDGYSDAAVGVPFTVGGNPGRVFVYPGGPAGIAAPADVALNDPDGATADFFAWSLGGGDFDGDGLAEVFTGAPRYGVGPYREPGSLFVFAGNAGGIAAPHSLRLDHPIAERSAEFGYASANAGDVNGDGYWDLVVGAPTGSAPYGCVFLYLGGPTGLSTTPAATLVHPLRQSYPGFGQTVI
ncbi:MAG: FG-GAP repeat protein [Deltaproteobacteria bacterium]|nr:FG-GAP repeat protein [Deltaproteobacteria bacterium]